MAFTEIPSSRVRQALESASDLEGIIGMNRFIDIALYNPEFGYYTTNRERVGLNSRTDFFTASSLKNAFAPILMEAGIGLLEKSGFDPQNVDWIEIGAEPGTALLDGMDSPFKSIRAIGVNEPICLNGNLVVFSNELFDALPFHSVVFRRGAWLERCLEIRKPGLRIVEKRPYSPEVIRALPLLPSPAPEGYIVDLSTIAASLLDRIGAQPWQGAFIALDYGKTWQSLTHDTPQGTARAYRKHAQSPDLLSHIGEQDLTCHVCWDWLERSLADADFRSIALESQESFILKRAPDFVRRAFESGSQAESEWKSQLRQLIHPTLMGQKFQSLSGVRTHHRISSATS